MFIIRVAAGEMLARINADAYAPDYLAHSRALDRSHLEMTVLGKLTTKPINNSIRGISGELDVVDADIPMFRPADISGGVASIETAPRLTKEFEAEHEKSRVHPGDLVLGIAGSIGVVGRVPPEVSFGNINGSSARLATNSDQRSAFLLAYLQTRYGQSALLRFSVGSVQKHLNLEDLPLVRTPLLKHLPERYIGNKVRQAERLRYWTTFLVREIDKHFAPLVQNPMASKSYWRVAPDAMSAHRLNPTEYDPVVFDLIRRAIASGVKLLSIGEILGPRGLSGGATPKGAHYVDKGILFARVQNVKPLALDLGDAVFIDDLADEELARSRCAADDIILTITGYPGTASLVADADLPVNINQHSIRIDCSAEYDAAYICAALNSKFVKYQVDRSAIGATRDALDYPSVGRLRIPLLDSLVMEDIADSVRDIVSARRMSMQLVSSARFLVEGLIEGQITETQLVDAQQALEAGDDSLDRAILARLKTDGLDGAGEPLFPDLDQLYDLLWQAQPEAGA